MVEQHMINISSIKKNLNHNHRTITNHHHNVSNKIHSNTLCWRNALDSLKSDILQQWMFERLLKTARRPIQHTLWMDNNTTSIWAKKIYRIRYQKKKKKVTKQMILTYLTRFLSAKKNWRILNWIVISNVIFSTKYMKAFFTRNS